MSTDQPLDFGEFYRELYHRSPFPWQSRVARRACEGDWPECIALPTSSGKTACIDIAVFAMAWQAHWPPEKRRTAPRRIFYVVDRRVVVDQALEHARQLSEKLRSAEKGTVRTVAERLRMLGGMDRPLDYYALRGGMYRESAWVRSPLQPTVITSTVDQVGSRLLFRGYGVSQSSRPLHAALIGNDALILLDEAHCSRSFEQTMSLVKKYRCLAQKPLHSPFYFVSMTATPSSPDTGAIEAVNDDDRNDPVLGVRISASKPTTLVVAKQASGRRWREQLVKELESQARALAEEGFEAVGVIVNRVATARELAKKLNALLLTGRMRPLDRDRLLETRLRPLLSGCAGTPPQFVVATQCLEVGADLDFHALVSECATLDALRQRFGRLNRIAARQRTQGVIVIRADQVEPGRRENDADPVYGRALPETWKWLQENQDGVTPDGVPWIDFGVASISKKWSETPAGRQQKVTAPAPDAAVLLPAHLDLLCQTAPAPAPDPDPAVFLHGPQPRELDVQVVFRDDLGDDGSRDHWREIVSLCPPSTAEALSVPISVFRRWLTNVRSPDECTDVEAELLRNSEIKGEETRWVLRWEGPASDQSKPVSIPEEIHPNATYVVPLNSDTDYSLLGDFPDGHPTDVGDEAFQRARDRAIIRPNVSREYASRLPQEDNWPDIDEVLDEALAFLVNDERQWVQLAVAHLSKRTNRVVRRHPAGGCVLIGKKRLRKFAPTFIEAEDSWELASPTPLPLADHCCDVARESERFARAMACPTDLVEVLRQAGLHHDAGKADPRFQAWMHGGNVRRASVLSQPVAKAIVSMPTSRDRNAARNRAELPRGFRHEMLSVQLAEEGKLFGESPHLRELFLHLIASHHGYARPFAPVVIDKSPPDVRINGVVLCADRRATLVPPHRIDSGIAERFWSLTRRFGWWGLPWLESMLRLADWSSSDTLERSTSDG